MKLALKRCSKNIISADCVNFDLTMSSLIHATLTNQIKINGLSVPEKYFDYGFSIIDMGKKIYTEKTL